MNSVSMVCTANCRSGAERSGYHVALTPRKSACVGKGRRSSGNYRAGHHRSLPSKAYSQART